ncbi:helix-turn-helix transcriptional regulator [Vineibacter terrae]|uniref:Helix-turn-helix transcriptional regulator n=1 Tax=Vineibacter terrae TaxID=2586908 RepID=A0A5C8PJW6_9HYPH|nr:AraC family transcriptional regulator [Vineibacter terrae]TXL74137.1 helix-turn-helix transcriptional regulator [Vineibacter terrae]
MTALVPPDLIPNWIPGEKTTDSAHLGWRGITLKGYRYGEQEADIPPMRDYMLVVYQGGKSTMRRRSGGRWHSEVVERGVISLLTRAEQSVWHWDQPIDVKHIHLQHGAIASTAEQVFERDLAKVDIQDSVRSEDAMMPLYLRMLEKELNGHGLGERLYVDAIRTQIAIHVLRHYAKVSFRSVESGSLEAGLSRRISEFIEERLSVSIALDDLASLTGLSPYHFSRKFKGAFGMAPHAYVVARRIARAKRLLRDCKLPIKVVAADCGFSDQSHLNRVFRRHTGTTPSRYRGDR